MVALAAFAEVTVTAARLASPMVPAGAVGQPVGYADTDSFRTRSASWAGIGSWRR